jgi:hypothetical protein
MHRANWRAIDLVREGGDLNAHGLARYPETRGEV